MGCHDQTTEVFRSCTAAPEEPLETSQCTATNIKEATATTHCLWGWKAHPQSDDTIQLYHPKVLDSSLPRSDMLCLVEGMHAVRRAVLDADDHTSPPHGHTGTAHGIIVYIRGRQPMSPLQSSLSCASWSACRRGCSLSPPRSSGCDSAGSSPSTAPDAACTSSP